MSDVKPNIQCGAGSWNARVFVPRAHPVVSAPASVLYRLSTGFPPLYTCWHTKNELTGSPGSSTWTVLPTPPAMVPVRIWLPVTPTAFGLMVSSSFVLWETLTLVVQERSRVGVGSRSGAINTRSKPVFFTLQML